MLDRMRSLLVAGVLVVALIAGCSSTVLPPPTASASAGSVGPASAAPPSTAPSVTASPLPSATPSSPTIPAGWQLVILPDQTGIALIADLASGPGRIVAVGALPPIGSAGAWSTRDGVAWVADPLPSDQRAPSRVVAWGDRFLAAGAGGFDCAHPVAVQTWVRSAEGSWRPAPADPKMCVGGMGELAVHGQTAVFAGIGSGDVPFVWSSADGLHWTDRAGAIQPDTAPNAVLADASGFTIFGSSPAGPWVARSADGSVWQSERLPGSASVIIVAAFHRNGQAAAIAESGSAVGVIAQDAGGAWQAMAADGLEAAILSRVVQVDGGLVALGGGESGPRAWASIDGTTWRTVELPAAIDASTSLSGALVANGRAFLGGQTTINGQAAGVIWSGPASLLAP
jgi:hypothetical protein